MSATNTTNICGYCGRPVLSGVWDGDFMYHLECTRGPNYQLSKQRVREIVREELATAQPKQGGV